MISFKCQRCGWCCKNKAINILYSDIKRWEKEDRKDILKEVSFVEVKNPKISGFYFVKTSIPNHDKCPFLTFKNDLAICSIYETRPKSCRNNPEIIPKELYKKWLGCPAFREVYRDWIKEQLN